MFLTKYGLHELQIKLAAAKPCDGNHNGEDNELAICPECNSVICSYCTPDPHHSPCDDE